MSGCWILDGTKLPTGYSLYFIFVNIILIGIVNFTMSAYLVLKADSLQKIAALGLIIMTCIMATVRVFFLFTSRFKIEELIGSTAHDIFQPNEATELEILQKGWKQFQHWRPMLIVWCTAAALSCNILPWFTKWNDGLIMLAWYPIIDTSKTPWFETVYTQQFLAIVYIGLIGTFTDITAAGCLAFIGSQCDLICHRLRQISAEQGLDDQKNALIKCINHHRLIIRCLHILQNIFGKIYFIQLYASLASLVMDFFLLSLADPKSFMFLYLAEYQVAVTIMLLVPCWFSTEMTRKSEKIPFAAYACDWTTSTNCFKKDLIFFIRNAQRPLKFVSGDYFEISVTLFIKVVKASFSYYAVLRSMKEQEEF